MAEVAAPPIWTNEMMDYLDHHDARTAGRQQQAAGEQEGEPQQQPDKQEAEAQQHYKRLRQDAEAAQEAAEAEDPGAEAEEAEPPSAETEELARTAANHWGWKTWSDTITDGDNHTTHAAICGPDGLVWTSSATSDGWRAQFPLSERSADARKLVRKMEMEAYFRGGEQKVRKMAAAQRLAWSLVMNDRLGADSPALALPFDLVEECSAAVARIHHSYQPGSSIYFGDEHWITLRYEPSDHPSQPSMLLARRGNRGLTAFLTEKCILIGVADMDAQEEHLHNASTMSLGAFADSLCQF